MVINKFSGVSTILLVKNLLEFNYSFNLKVFLLPNYSFLFSKLSVYSYSAYERHRKKLIIFLFLGLLHILSCHQFMSHSTQLQSSLLKKQFFLHFHRGHVFLIPWFFVHLWTLSNMSTCFFKCGDETGQSTPSEVSLVLSKVE